MSDAEKKVKKKEKKAKKEKKTDDQTTTPLPTAAVPVQLETFQLMYWPQELGALIIYLILLP